MATLSTNIGFFAPKRLNETTFSNNQVHVRFTDEQIKKTIKVGQTIEISGSNNYDGTYQVVDVWKPTDRKVANALIAHDWVDTGDKTETGSPIDKTGGTLTYQLGWFATPIPGARGLKYGQVSAAVALIVVGFVLWSVFFRK